MVQHFFHESSTAIRYIGRISPAPQGGLFAEGKIAGVVDWGAGEFSMATPDRFFAHFDTDTGMSDWMFFPDKSPGDDFNPGRIAVTSTGTLFGVMHFLHPITVAGVDYDARGSWDFLFLQWK